MSALSEFSESQRQRMSPTRASLTLPFSAHDVPAGKARKKPGIPSQ